MGTAAMRSEALHVTSISYELGGTPQILVSPENVDQQTVGRLERNFEHAMVEILVNLGLKKLPLLPSPKTLHLMAKAAVTVYEAAVENQGCDD
jgi:branched-subunit amino acid transport protein AzlD